MDRRDGLFSEVSGTDESHTRLTLDSADAADAERKIRDAVERYA